MLCHKDLKNDVSVSCKELLICSYEPMISVIMMFMMGQTHEILKNSNKPLVDLDVDDNQLFREQ